MNRRGFIRSLFASSAVIVIAPADALEHLSTGDPHRTWFDMGRGVPRPTLVDWGWDASFAILHLPFLFFRGVEKI